MFMAVGGERFVFKCVSARLRRGFTGCKTAMTSYLLAISLTAMSFLVFFSSQAITLLFLRPTNLEYDSSGMCVHLGVMFRQWQSPTAAQTYS